MVLFILSCFVILFTCNVRAIANFLQSCKILIFNPLKAAGVLREFLMGYVSLPLYLHNLIPDRIFDQFNCRFQLEFFHDVVLMGLHGADADIELVADLFVDKSFYE